MSIEKRKPTKEFYSALDDLITHHVKSREAFDKAIKLGQNQGFSDFEIILFIKEYLKEKIPHSSLYRYINELKPEVVPLGQIDYNTVLEHSGTTEKELILGYHPKNQDKWNDWVKIEDIKIGKRLRENPRLDAKPDIVKNIKKHGLLSPIIVSKNNLLVIGYRRLEACKKLGWKIVPVWHDERYDDNDESEILRIQLVENVVRRVSTIEDEREFQKLMRKEYAEEIEFDWDEKRSELLSDFYMNHFDEPDFDKQYNKYERELNAQIKVIEIEDIINSGQSPEKILRRIYRQGGD